MAESPRIPTPDDPGGGNDSTPRWVVVFGIIGGLLVLLLVVLHLAVGGLGDHTP